MLGNATSLSVIQHSFILDTKPLTSRVINPKIHTGMVRRKETGWGPMPPCTFAISIPQGSNVEQKGGSKASAHVHRILRKYRSSLRHARVYYLCILPDRGTGEIHKLLMIHALALPESCKTSECKTASKNLAIHREKHGPGAPIAIEE